VVGVWLGVGVVVAGEKFGSERDERLQPILIRAMIRKMDIQRLFISFFLFFLKYIQILEIQATLN